MHFTCRKARLGRRVEWFRMKAYLVVLDWEENESLWVGAEEWLIHLLWLNAWCDQGHIDLLLFDPGLGLGGDFLEGDVGGGWHVLLSNTKVELFHWRLELGGGSLQEKLLAIDLSTLG